VADDDAFDDLPDQVFLARRQAAGCFELELQLLVGTSLGLVEEQLIGTDAQGYCELAQGVEGWL